MTAPSLSIRDALERYQTQEGVTLLALSRRSPVLLVFLRHFGWTFCRQALADLKARRAAIEAKGTQLAFVHMGTETQAREFFAQYGWVDVARISDPACELYRAFGLARGSLGQLAGPSVLARGVTALFGGHGLGLPVGDPLQMPGVFLLRDGEIVREHRHETIAEVPDYEALARHVE